MNIFTFIRIICFKIKILLYRIVYPHIILGENIKGFGNPVFRLKGKVILGNNLVFINNTRNNFIGLSKACSIYVEKKAHLEIGDYTGFSGVSIFCAQSIIIGQYCNFGGNVSIWDTDFHPLNYKARRNNINYSISEPIQIGDDVFIGANSIILKGIKIGNRSIIGAGSVVTKNIPEDEIWAGNPAKFIRKIS